MATSGQDVVNYLKQFLGTPYQWGGNSLSSGIDCSGLLQQGFAHFGIKIPRTTYDQIGEGKSIDLDHLQVGDAVFFDTDPNTKGPDHVGIYIGNGKMLQAPHTGDVVKVTDITQSYWTSKFMGGRRFDGVDGGGPSNQDWSTQTPVEKKLSPQDMAAQYGWAYSFLNSDPSLKNLFNQAVDGSWTNDKFQAELKNTDFWRSNSDTARLALQQKTSDPATWSATIDANKFAISDLASKIGAAVPDSMLPKIAEQMAMTNMNEDQLRQVLAGYIDFTKNGTLTGEAGMYEHTMRQYSDSMGVDMNQQSIKNYAQLMVKGLSTPQDFQNFIKEQATSAFPAFQKQIQAGQTMQNIANPYIQQMAQSLEINPNSINLKDPTILAGLNGIDASGKPTGKNLVDFQDVLRGDPRWGQTQQAQDKVMNIGRTVLQNMGVISG
jgi:hypothetical protein